eukprot:CAMPEP_0202965566 /NCGR_PEP_ID=MMETSP1396-20130829/9495_1 /ASSEMBLY_ACC=CAM_ASM_000872 /TAXON_ID= /ORGANISM="Pseudokeronopsis sp., Strain Brazil" /LENGTH=164 /DNA_ID=CAMNT_0049688317 /DNA_START=1327 /DNA_END=1821 /DNA_ORIENTATION=-
MKELKQEAGEMKRELNQLERVKKQVEDDAKSNRVKLRDCQKDLKAADPKELELIAAKFKELQEQAGELKGEFDQQKENIEEKIRALRDYLSKHNKLQALMQKLGDELGRTKDKYSSFENQLNDVSQSTRLLKQVLSEMERGKERDYQDKETFIREKTDELDEID